MNGNSRKLFRPLIAVVAIMVLALPMVMFADNLQGDDLTAGGNTTKNPGQTGTARFYLVANGSDGCNVDSSHSATVTVSSDQSWLTIDSPNTASLTACGSDHATTIGYSVSSSAPVGGIATVSGVASGGLATGNGYNNNPGKFTVTVEAVPAPSDTTPPVITPSVSGTLGNNGWYTSDVTVSWSVVDNESAISSSSGCDETIISSDTAGRTLTCEATSAGGTSSESVTIKRDATPPTVTCPNPAPKFLLNESGKTIGASVSDSLSQPLNATESANADTSSVGSNSVSITGYDNAGNSASASCSYSVGYNFIGFSSPVDNNSVLNKAKAGQAIPLKWQLLDANNAPVTNLSSVSLSVANLACSSGIPTDDLEVYAAGASGLQNLGGGYYQYNWKSPTTYANSCKTLKLDLGEVTPRTALFQFVK